MKLFIIKTLIFIVLAASLFFISISFPNKHFDPFYGRFTSPKQENLILGTSRSAQGIQPQILKDEIGLSFYNYSFTLGNSPFGDTYLNSIKKKLNNKTSDQVFIVAVDPWSISNEIEYNDQYFPEDERFLAYTTNVNSRFINYRYLINYYKGRYLELIKSFILTRRNKHPNYYTIHDDGWLEINVSMDSEDVNMRTKEKIESYRDLKQKRSFSQYRYDYLIKTIKYLRKYGVVYLVRLPVCDDILIIENDFMPNFNSKMNALNEEIDGYFDLTTQDLQIMYTDGNHIYRESAIEVTKLLANNINKLKNKNE